MGWGQDGAGSGLAINSTGSNFTARTLTLAGSCETRPERYIKYRPVKQRSEPSRLTSEVGSTSI